MMKGKFIRLSRRYREALRRHLKQGPAGNLQPARGLGREAVHLGLETLDVARIHEGALAKLAASGSRDGITKRAQIFFTEAVAPIEKTHRAAVNGNAFLKQLNKRLDRKTLDLAASNRSLKESIARRKTVEAAFQKRGGRSRKLLEQSRRLQKNLQHLTHRNLSQQEEKRKKISHELQDEIAQTLLAINVRLLTLRKHLGVNALGLKIDIASTQRLVNKSVKMIKRFAREFGRHDEA